MKLRKLLLGLGLLLAVMGIGLASGGTTAKAVSLPSGATAFIDQSGGGFLYRPNNWNTVPNTDNGNYLVSNYPTLPSTQGLAADGVTNGRVTTKTKKIFMRFSDTLSARGFSFGKVYVDLMDKNGKSINTAPVKDVLNGSSASSYSFSASTWYEIDVNLTNLKDLLPIYVGFRYTIPYMNDINPSYYRGTFQVDKTVQQNMAPVTIKQTAGFADDKTPQVLSSDDTITGTSGANMNISLPITASDGTIKTFTTTSDSNGNFSIPLGTSLKNLGDPDGVTVTESNEFGDEKTGKANVLKSTPLVISATNKSITALPDDLTAMGSDSDSVSKWLEDKAGLTTAKTDGTAVTSADGLKYSVDNAGLASSLASLSNGGTTTVNVSATDTAGDTTTSPLEITVAKSDGLLSFGAISDTMSFGSLAVPTKETLFAPSKVAVNVNDTRAAGSTWSVSANATPLKTSDGNHVLNGDMVYVDNNSVKHSLTNQDVVVGSGTREAKQNSVDMTDGWPVTGKDITSTPAGIYLDAKPNIYSGSSATSYSGQILWTLSNAPGTAATNIPSSSLAASATK
ncbi:hypothetical protein [Levilactobacillus yonginensis]